MYCKKCGKEIPDDSKFCQHCGSSQTTQGNYTNTLSKYNNYIGIYAIWVVINIILYCYGIGDSYSKLYFYPFTKNNYYAILS